MLPASLRTKPPLWPEPVEPDPTCVCGHRFSAHPTTQASVELPANPRPTYKPFGSPIVAKPPADDTYVISGLDYTMRPCTGCDCSIPTHDQCEYRVTVDDQPNSLRRFSSRCRRDYGHDGRHQP